MAVAARALEGQLAVLQAHRHELDALYTEQHLELERARAGALRAKEELQRACAAREQLAAENEALRRDNSELARQIAAQQLELQKLLHRLDGGAAPLENGMGCSDDLTARVKRQLPSSGEEIKHQLAMQQGSLDAIHLGLQLARAKLEQERTCEELRVAHEALAQLQQTALSMSADFGAATRQIGKLEERIIEQARKFEDEKVSSSAVDVELCHLREREAQLLLELEQAAALRAKVEAEAEERLVQATMEADRRCRECDERDRHVRMLLDRLARKEARSTAALRNLHEDALARTEENTMLRRLSQRLGATPLDLQRASRRTRMSWSPTSEWGRRPRPRDASRLSETACQFRSEVPSAAARGVGSHVAPPTRRSARNLFGGSGNFTPNSNQAHSYGGEENPMNQEAPLTYQSLQVYYM